jgi:hypothetical protein
MNGEKPVDVVVVRESAQWLSGFQRKLMQHRSLMA